MEGEIEVARLVKTGYDFPWEEARVEPEPAFEAVRPLFVDELKLATEDDVDEAAWEAAYLRIRARLRLISPEGLDVPEFLLHIHGDKAWWRWSDEPFEQPSQAEAGTPPALS